MYQIPYPDEVEEKHHYCRLHIQIWTYIVSAALAMTAIIGIIVGIIMLVYSELHEGTVLYKQTLVYFRRANPVKYWFFYKIFASLWIGFHAVLLFSIISNIFAIRPNIVVCIFHVGAYIFLLSALIVLSVTETKTTWLALSIVLFFSILVAGALSVLALFHRFLDEKAQEMKVLMANTKSVHFKERKS